MPPRLVPQANQLGLAWPGQGKSALVAFVVRMPVVAETGIVALSGFLHGYAHGIEAPGGGSMLAYGAGFIAATMMLHLAGMLSGVLARGAIPTGLLRAGGGAITTASMVLLALA